MTNKVRYASHPGVYIKDAIEELGMSQSEFAIRSGLSIKNVSTLINGESNITFEVAKKLGSFFQNGEEGWIGLQTRYDLYTNQEKIRLEYADDWEIVKNFDKNFIRQLMGIEIKGKSREEDREQVIDELRKKFNVGELTNLKTPDLYVFYKTHVNKELNEKTIILRNAWISLAEKEARKKECKEYNKDIILSNLEFFRSLTLEMPDTFIPKINEKLAEAGIKFVILPYLYGSNFNGITKWINKDKCVLLAINDCGKDAGKLWFTFFHELGHALQNNKRQMTIFYDNKAILDDNERKANEFAKDCLIDKQKYNEFVNKGCFNINEIVAFSRKLQIPEFIVIGRLQNDGLVPWNLYQDRKVRYTIQYEKV
ncbi:MAG: HigA family addiction module antidote protein [Bacilli bacterium]|nr:HigA family addiction module antidote protein [Bacilli bacterium]